MDLQRDWNKRESRVRRIMERVIIIVTLPLWLPFYLLEYAGEVAGETLVSFENLMDYVLEKTIPKLKIRKKDL